MRSLIAVVVLIAAITPAQAQWGPHRHGYGGGGGGGGGFGVYVVPPPVVIGPPLYAPVPFYAPPPAYACYAGPVSCPLPGPQPVGSPCRCWSGYGTYHGRAG